MLIIKKTYKALRTLLLCIYYDLAGKNISLEGRHFVLTLLASLGITLQLLMTRRIIQEHSNCKVTKQSLLSQRNNLYL